MTKIEIVGGEPDSSSKPDPFNLDALRVDPSFEKVAGVKKVLSTVPVRKPGNQEWFWVHPELPYRMNFKTIKLDEGGDFYLVTPQVACDYPDHVKEVTLYTCVNQSGVVSLWPCRMPAADKSGKRDGWAESAHEAAAAGMRQRIRIKANMSLGAYEFFTSDSTASGNVPLWPKESLGELVHIAFRKTGRLVESVEHPVMQSLLGRV